MTQADAQDIDQVEFGGLLYLFWLLVRLSITTACKIVMFIHFYIKPELT